MFPRRRENIMGEKDIIGMTVEELCGSALIAC
jgi:hypothetical protein